MDWRRGEFWLHIVRMKTMVEMVVNRETSLVHEPVVSLSRGHFVL